MSTDAAAQQTPMAGPQVLVVDDEPLLVEELVEGLGARGIAAIGASSGVEALQLMDTLPELAVVVTDIRMPGMQGFEVLRAARERPGGAAPLEVVMITGHGTIDDAARAMRGGACDFLPKPFTLKQAEEAIRVALDRAATTRRDYAGRHATEARLREAESRVGALQTQLDQGLRRLAATDTGLAESIGDPAQRLQLLSHELRTPLVPIMGFANLLRDGGAAQPGGGGGNAGGDIGAIAQEIEAGGQRLLKTVDKLLTFERLSSGAVGVRPERVAASSVVRAAVTAVSPLAEDQGVAILPPAPEAMEGLWLQADRNLAVQALTELLDNAVRASPKGMAVEIAAERLPVGEGRVLLAVRDTGAGAPPEILREPGRPFTVGGPVLSRPRDGLGLGLAIVRRIATLHGGALALSARPGPAGGTEARVDFPAAPPP